MCTAQCTLIRFPHFACLSNATKPKFAFFEYVCMSVCLLFVYSFDFVTSCWNKFAVNVLQSESVFHFFSAIEGRTESADEANANKNEIVPNDMIYKL